MLNLNLSNVETKEAPSSGPLPEGKYHVAITDAQVRETRAGTGQYIKTEFTVMEGDYAKRKLWHNFNIKNPNEQAVEIGLQQIKDMLTAAQSKLADGTLNSVSELKGLRMQVNVKHEVSESYGTQARINYFEQLQRESEVHPGVPNEAPQFSSDEDLPF